MHTRSHTLAHEQTKSQVKYICDVRWATGWKSQRREMRQGITSSFPSLVGVCCCDCYNDDHANILSSRHHNHRDRRGKLRSLTYIDCWTAHSGAGRQWSLQPAAATPAYPFLCVQCSLHLEQIRVDRKSQYVTAARCIPAADCTVQ